MTLNDVNDEKSLQDVQVENVSDDKSVLDTAIPRIEGEVFPGINWQTILAFLVRVLQEHKCNAANILHCRPYVRN